jgi:zinc transport system substrate-binding protein
VLLRLAPLVVLVVLLAACGGEPAAEVDDAPTPATTPTPEVTEMATPEDEPESTPTPAADLGAGITVVTTVFPLASIAEEIAPGADVTLLTSSGQDPHDLELSPADRALLESADVVLYMGDLDFQPQVEAAVASATGEVVSVADVAGSGNLRDFDAHSHDDDHADEDDEHSDDDADDGHGHDDETTDDGHDDDEASDDTRTGDIEAVDPHIWFDASIMAEVAEEVAEALAAVDAEHADGYRENGEALHDELLALDEELDTLLSECTFDTAIVSHEAYSYLLEPRGLEQAGVSGAGGHGDASPQRLAELVDRIRAEGISAVLAEPLEGRSDAEALAREAGVDLLEIDPLEIGTDELNALGYPAALRQQAETFATALECG